MSSHPFGLMAAPQLDDDLAELARAARDAINLLLDPPTATAVDMRPVVALSERIIMGSPSAAPAVLS